MKSNILSNLSQLGKAFMLPVSILPIAGLLLGIGGAFSNPNNIAAFPFLDNKFLQAIFITMSGAGTAVFSNLFLIIAVGLTIGFAKKDKSTAALAALVGYVIMSATITSLITVFSTPEQTIDTGAVGSITLAFLCSTLHNKYRNIRLPDFLGFFGGSRFVPIITAIASMFLAVIFFLIWPPVQDFLVLIGQQIANLGHIGTFLYGFLLRLTGAIGLHHMIYSMFWWTEVGGTEVVNGVEVIGAQNIYFAQLADPNHQGLYSEATRFFAGRFTTMMFGLPGAALAMYHCIPKTINPKIKKQMAGLFFSVALTSFVTGITEPLEFLFLFVSPLLYLWHAFLDGLAFMISDIININIGNTFSGGIIDFTLFGILQTNAQTNWIKVIILGAIWFVIYYTSFKFFILKFNIMTPGRDINETEITVTSKDSINEESLQIIKILGGEDNLIEVDACITRLRVTLKDKSIVNLDDFKALGSKGVVEVGDGLQIIFGAKAIRYKSCIVDILNLD